MNKKHFLSSFVIVVFTLYAIYKQSDMAALTYTDSPSPITANSGGDTNPIRAVASARKRNASVAEQNSIIPTQKMSSAVTNPSVPVLSNSGRYKDGVYIGPATDAYYGNVQVQVTVSGGALTNVVFLDYPQDRGTSRRINSSAVPQLSSEAIKSQSAQVDIISGATQTSRAFTESLGEALAQAAN